MEAIVLVHFTPQKRKKEEQKEVSVIEVYYSERHSFANTKREATLYIFDMV